MKYTNQALFIFALLLFFQQSSAASLSPNTAERISAYLQRASENGYSGAVLFAVGEKTIVRQGFGFADKEQQIPVTPETVFDIGSLTKQFTAAAILTLEMQKKLSVKDTLDKYLGNVPDEKKAITLHQVLTHSAGLTDSLGPDEEYIGREEYVKLALAEPLIQPPGKYSYSNVGYSLLAAVIEKISGQDYEAYLRQAVLLPAGMKKTGYILAGWDKKNFAIGYRNNKRWGTTYDQSNYGGKGVTWHLKGNGGILSTADDLHKWSVALKGTAILSEDAKQKYFQPHVPEDEDGSSHYAYGWVVQKNRRNQKVIAHNGGNGFFMATFAMIPEIDAAIVVTSNHAPKNTDVIATRIDRIAFDDLQPLSQEFRNAYSGTYELPSGSRFTLSFDENDEAVAMLNNRETWLLMAGSKSDTPEAAQKCDQKTKQLMDALQKEDFAAAAALASGETDAAGEWKEMRMNLLANHGELRDTHVLGTVSRRGGDFQLTAVRLVFARKEIFQLFIWQKERLFDVRTFPEGNSKNFEFQQGNEFYSESNDMKVVFQNDGKRITMTIHDSNGKPVIARKL